LLPFSPPFLFMLYPLSAIAVYGLLFGLRYLLTFLDLKKTKFQYAEYTLKSSAEVPDYIQQLFQSAIQELAPLGFKPCRYRQIKPIFQIQPPTFWGLLFYHPGCKTYAEVDMRLWIETGDRFEISFVTFFRDKSWLITMNGKAHRVIDDRANTILQDAYVLDVVAQWQVHQTRLQALAATQPPFGLAPEAFTKLMQRQTKQYIDRAVEQQILSPDPTPGLFRYKTQAVLKKVHPLLKGSQKAAKLSQQRQKAIDANPTAVSELPIELEVESFERMEKMQQGGVSRKFRGWLLIGSLAAFVAVYTHILTPARMLIFVGVLLFHEAGHIVAMRLCGYRNTAILFLPFLGALATASHREGTTLSQKVWISIAGPLPGLSLGIGLALALQTGWIPPSQQADWMHELQWILIGLNLFNLLPIYPLDGGQIADLLLVSIHPYLGVLFKLCGVVVLGLLSLVLGKPLLFGFTVLIGLTLPHSFRSAKAIAKLHKSLRQRMSADRTIDRQLTLALIVKQMRQLGYGQQPFSKRYTLAKELLDRRHELRAKWITKLALVLLYGGSLIGGVAGTIQAIAPEWIEVAQSFYQTPEQRRAAFLAKQQRQIQELTASIQRNPNDAEAYANRANAKLFLNDLQGAIADSDQVIRLKPNDTEALLTRARFRQQAKDLPGALQDLDRAIEIDPKDKDAYYHRAMLDMALQNHQAALNDYNQIVILDPQDLSAYLGRGQMRCQLKDYKGAIADANAVIALEPRYPEAYDLRSEARQGLGDRAGAIADQQKAEELADSWDDDLLDQGDLLDSKEGI
jgi:tetratricopeptide (TPR) repeat protein/Zn-dependent protease